VQSFPVFCVEKGFPVVEAKLLGTEVKAGLGEENEEALNAGIKKMRTEGQDQNKNNQVSPVDRHKQNLPGRFLSSHATIIADPALLAKSKNVTASHACTGS
jgi:hypothetical protein